MNWLWVIAVQWIHEYVLKQDLSNDMNKEPHVLYFLSIHNHVNTLIFWKLHIAALKTCLLLNQFSLSYNPHSHPFSLFSSQRNWQASPSQVKKVKLEVRMWALGSNKKLICLLAHYCGLWLPGPSKWKSNVALHYPFGIQLIAQADSEFL